jgi:hypothetical protein
MSAQLDQIQAALPNVVTQGAVNTHRISNAERLVWFVFTVAATLLVALYKP